MAFLEARFKPGVNVPVFANAAIIGGRFVKIVGNKTSQGDYLAQQCVAGDHAFGVAEQDSGPTTQDANSQERRVNIVRAPAIARVQPGAAIDASAGAVAVKSDANGKAITQGGTGTITGYALHSCQSTDDFVEVALVF